MNTLTTSPVAPLLDRLFAMDAAANPSTDPSTAEYWSSLTAEDRARLVRSRDDYLGFYGRMKDVPLAVSRETGALLYMLIRSGAV